MFTEVQIENYKSIQNLKIGLGRVNVFIGENGCGKSNILEAIALAGAAAGNKLDNEFLAPRGIRVTEPEFMRSAFEKKNVIEEIKISLKRDKIKSIMDEIDFNFSIIHNNQPYSNWTQNSGFKGVEALINIIDKDNEEEFHHQFLDFVQNLFQDFNKLKKDKLSSGSILSLEQLEISKKLASEIEIEHQRTSNNFRKNSLSLRKFIIYSPENSSLRTFEEEGQIQPLGSKGQGLLKLLRVLNSSPDKINEIKQKLELIDWFDDFKVPDYDLERIIQIKDRYLDKELPYFNQRSSNEGFLFLMFYFALFVSDDTPNFFAIDNIENALNPKLCTKLIQELVKLAKDNNKQVIFTTHNPAVLDGLDLHDDDQRLFTIYRNIYGHTKAERIFAPQPLEDQEPVPLSEAFMNGYIGGLPDNF